MTPPVATTVASRDTPTGVTRTRQLLEDIVAFACAVFRRWVLFVTSSGAVAVFGSYLWLSSPQRDAMRSGGLLIIGAAVAVGVFSAWREEYRRRLQLEQRPRLRLTFAPGLAPFEQRHPAGRDSALIYHLVRVGVTHDGQGNVDDVRVLVESIDPMQPGFPLFHALEVMRNGGEAETVAAGTTPACFFDVVLETRELVGGPRSDPGGPVLGRGELNVRLARQPFRLEAPAGDLTIHLVAQGRDAARATGRLVLRITPSLTYEPQFN